MTLFQDSKEVNKINISLLRCLANSGTPDKLEIFFSENRPQCSEVHISGPLYSLRPVWDFQTFI